MKVGIAGTVVAAVVAAVVISLPPGIPGEMDKALRLVDATIPTAVAANATPTISSVKSGVWSDPTVWDQGRLPQTDDKVVVAAPHALIQDVSTPRLKWLRLDGSLTTALPQAPPPPPPANITLSQIIAQQPAALQTTLTTIFAVAGIDPNANLPLLPRPPPSPVAPLPVQLWVETLVTTPGSMLSATPESGQWTILFADYGPIDTVADPWMISRGAIFMGPVALNGANVSPWILTTGNVAGDTTITLKSPAVGWKAGDTLLIPGGGFTVNWPNLLVNDDDQATIQSVSADGLTVTLTAPLKFAHAATDWEGKPRSMFAANITPRSVHFVSENTSVVAQRAHVMFMRSDLTTAWQLSNVSFAGLGRTDKSQIVTDPDGQGNGLANPRARYAVHFHEIDPNPSGTPASLSQIVVLGTPGWGVVNHHSFVYCDYSVVADAYGASYVGEIGDENGRFSKCVSIRNSIPYKTAISGNVGALVTVGGVQVGDWGKFGSGFFTMAGGISLQNNITTGCPNTAYVFMGLPFGKPGVNPTYPAAWLSESGVSCNDNPDGTNTPKTQYANSTLILQPLDVPQNHFGNQCFGCYCVANIWDIGGNGVMTPPPAGRHNFQAFTGEYFSGNGQAGIDLTYSSNLDLVSPSLTTTAPDYVGSGIGNSGVATNQNYVNAYVSGSYIGIEAPDGGNNSIENPTTKALCGIHVTNEWEYPRVMPITTPTFLAPDPATLAAIVKADTWGSSPYVKLLNKQTYDILCESRFVSADITQTYGSDRTILEYFQSAYGMTSPDTVTLQQVAGGPVVYLFYWEQDPNYVPSQYTTPVPSFMQGLTGAQIAQQYGLWLGGKILPADAANLPGSKCLFSATDETLLTDVQLSKNHSAFAPGNYQLTSTPIGYVPQVMIGGKTVTMPALNLTDKDWTVPRVPDGAGNSRGVPIYCNSTQTFPSNW